jgi:hypothetical protein
MNTTTTVRLALKDKNLALFKELAATGKLASFEADAMDLIGGES